MMLFYSNKCKTQVTRKSSVSAWCCCTTTNVKLKLYLKLVNKWQNYVTLLLKQCLIKAEEFLFDLFAVPWKCNCHKSFIFDKLHYAVFEYLPFHRMIFKYEFDITDSDCIKYRPEKNKIHWLRVCHMCINSTF